MEAMQQVRNFFTAENERLPSVEVDVPSLLAYIERPNVEAAYAGPMTHSVYDITLMVMSILLMQGAGRLERLQQLRSKQVARSHLGDLKKSLVWAGNMTTLTQAIGGVASIGLQGFSNRIADGLVGTPRSQPWAFVQTLTFGYFSPADAVARDRQHKAITGAIGALPQWSAMSGQMIQTKTAPEGQILSALQQQEQQSADSKSGKLSELSQTSDKLAQMAQEMIRQQGQLGAQVAQAASAA
jgi:hypothetical protein